MRWPRRREEPRQTPQEVADKALARFASELDGYGPAEALLALLRLREHAEQLAVLFRDQAGVADAVLVELRGAQALGRPGEAAAQETATVPCVAPLTAAMGCPSPRTLGHRQANEPASSDGMNAAATP